MHFKIKNTDFKISFTFFALILIFTACDKIYIFLPVILFSLFHESVHLLFLCVFCSPPKKITLSLFGADMQRRENSSASLAQEFIINISAPLANIILGIVFAIISKQTKLELSEFSQMNFVLGIFNLLPFYNLDGGNALKNILLMKIGEDTSEKILTVTSVIVTVLFSILSVYVFFYEQQNYMLLILSGYFTAMIIFKK